MFFEGPPFQGGVGNCRLRWAILSGVARGARIAREGDLVAPKVVVSCALQLDSDEKCGVG